MTDRPVPESKTIDTLVRTFTQSELALADVSTAITKFQTATEQLAAAHADAVAAVEVVTAANEASREVSRQLERLVAGLGEAVAALRAVDPDRLWTRLDASAQRHEVADGQRLAEQIRLDRRLTLLLRITSLAALAAAGALVVASLVAADLI